MLFGRGAGGRPTASAVLGDVIDAAAQLAAEGSLRPLAAAPAQHPADRRARAQYYVAIDVADRPGVLATVATAFGGTTSRSARWSRSDSVTRPRLVFITHLAVESDVQATLARARAASTSCGASAASSGSSGRNGRVTGVARGRVPHDGTSRAEPDWPGVIRRYAEFLPVTGATPVVTLLEGDTPLLPAPRLSERVGAEVYLKIEGPNPDGFVQGPGMTVAISKALEAGAAGGRLRVDRQHLGVGRGLRARAGMTCFVLVPRVTSHSASSPRRSCTARRSSR